MLTIMILEDCLESRIALEAMIKEIKEGIHIFSFSTFQEAEAMLIKEETVDLFLLDIHLKNDDNSDQSGLMFAKKIRQDIRYVFTPIIFVTSFAELEIRSYREAQCYRYITKPYSKEEIKNTIFKVLDYKEALKDKHIMIKKDGINYRIKINEIVYIKAIPRGIELILLDEIVPVKYLSIKQILVLANMKCLVQCHRMYVVNANYIEYIDYVNRIIKMNGYEEKIEIGVTYKNELRCLIHG